MENKNTKQLALLIVMVMLCTNLIGQSLTSYVNPFIGTSGTGHTYPGVSLPFGMVQLSPDTQVKNWSACSGYQYNDKTLLGFSHTHMSGTGGADLADVLFLPCADNSFQDKIFAECDKKSEKAEVGYYSTKLKNGIKAELSATHRCGVHKYTYPSETNNYLYIDLVHVLKESEEVTDAQIEIVDDYTVKGYRLTDGWAERCPVYFVAKFSKKITGHVFTTDGVESKSEKLKGDKIKGFLEFTADKKPLEIHVGISATGFDGAEKNLNKEIGSKSFNDIRSEAVVVWEKELSKIKITGSKNQKGIFYTSLYHSLLSPSIFNDVDGKYKGMDDKNHESSIPNYHVFSFWDTFRAVHPLFTVIQSERNVEMVNSLLNKYKELGKLPKWELWGSDTDCMIGNHGVAVIADAMMKDVKGFDYKLAYEACKVTIERQEEQLDLHRKYGFIPCNVYEKKCVSKSLEYTYNDWCMSVMAEKLGYANDYKNYTKRAQNYKKLFNGANGFLAPRENTGIFKESFSPNWVGPAYTEATPWQYRHFVLHDVTGLANLLGGRDSLTQSLDDLFSADTLTFGYKMPDITGKFGQYAHGNEPSHSTPFLYAYSSEPWKTQLLTREIIDRFYFNNTIGLCGNDDCGQLSSWYIFASLGFYPMCPGSSQYVVTSPIFKESSISVGNGKKFTIRTKGNLNNVYIESLVLNGNVLDRNYLTHAEIMKGGEMIVQLSDQPNKIRALKDLPYSMNKSPKVSIPFVKKLKSIFKDTQEIELFVRNKGAEIYYTVDGSSPSKGSKKYTCSFIVDQTVELKAVAYKKDMRPSDMFIQKLEKADYLQSVACSPLFNGIKYEYYEGHFQHTDDLLKAIPVKSGICGSISRSEMEKVTDKKDYYGFIFTSHLFIADKDIYTFHLQADDGAHLYIDGREVVDNDGSHSEGRGYGSIALDKGYHEVELRYFETYGGNSIMFGVAGGKLDTWSIPNKLFFVNFPMEKPEEISWVGKKLPNLSIPSTNGDLVKLSKIKGKYIILDFWASWCGPCCAEIPAMKKLYENYHPKGLEIVSISLDKKKEKWNNALNKYKMPWIQLSNLKGWKGEAADALKVNSIPAIFILDKKGNIVSEGLRGEALEKEIHRLLH